MIVVIPLLIVATEREGEGEGEGNGTLAFFDKRAAKCQDALHHEPQTVLDHFLSYRRFPSVTAVQCVSTQEAVI